MTIGQIDIIKVKTKKQLKKFIHLPAKIHRNHSNWVPPIYMDERQFYNRRKNESFSYCDTILLLAMQNNECVGRIMGIINHKYNKAHNENDARFCFLETYDDYKVANKLLTAIEEWAITKGKTGLVGPLGFSDKDPQGFLFEGFDQPSVIATVCNFPYMLDFVERSGFTKKIDLVTYKIDVPETVPEFYKKIYQRALNNNGGIRVINFSSRKQLKPYVRPVLELMNKTFIGIYAYSPLSAKEMDEFASRYLMVLDPRFVKVIENEKDEVIAFILGMPDISDGIKKSNGYMFPLGFIQVLRSQKKTKQLNLLLGGISAEYRNKGLDTILGVEMLESANKRGMKYIDSHLELETNLKMRAEMEKMGGAVYKRFRIYTKAIGN